MKNLPYWCAYLVPAAMLFGFARGSPWPGVVFVAFGAVVALDIVVVARGAPVESGRDDVVLRLAMWLWLPTYAALLLLALIALTRAPWSLAQFIGTAMGVGMTGGMLAGPVAHDLMHRRSRGERVMAEVLLALCGYAHFCVEHVRGHHVRVATAHDAATARAGESVYRFLARALPDGFVDAWRLEAARLQARGRHWLSPQNAVVRGVVLTVLAGAVATAAFGLVGIAFVVVQGAIAALVLETINYVQHYALERRALPDGGYEPVSAMHAWNADHRVSNYVLLGLGCHSDHHCHPGKSCASLGVPASAPTLPTGLCGMCMLALVPPLWFAVMDPLAAHYRRAAAPGAAAEVPSA